jgi:hypothetical protein
VLSWGGVTLPHIGHPDADRERYDHAATPDRRDGNIGHGDAHSEDGRFFLFHVGHGGPTL